MIATLIISLLYLEMLYANEQTAVEVNNWKGNLNYIQRLHCWAVVMDSDSQQLIDSVHKVYWTR